MEAARALAKTGSELGRRLNPTGIVAASGSCSIATSRGAMMIKPNKIGSPTFALFDGSTADLVPADV